jgi:hypothetical protein
MTQEEERAAAAERVRIKRAMRRLLNDVFGIEGVGIILPPEQTS